MSTQSQGESSVEDMSTQKDTCISIRSVRKRGQWGNRAQFLLTCIGLSVGLGNIWRFPTLAYANGGSAFLFPYMICSLIFGLPALYLEFVVGQFTRTGPASCFKHFMPALQGIGWTMILVACTIGIYYTVIIAWTGVYLAFAWRDAENWAKCDNEWNTLNCTSQIQNDDCGRILGLNVSAVYYNGTCILPEVFSNSTMNGTMIYSGTEEYFDNFILQKDPSILDFSHLNVSVTVSLLLMWIIIVLILSKGVKLIGYSSYVTATFPYLIIIALFIRAVTLDGAMGGIEWYIGKPDFKYLLEPKTWRDALTQLCFSLSIGWGGLLSMASYNDRTNNCYTDAVIVVAADFLMSVFGGCTVFGILGYLAKQSGKPLEKVVQSGTALAFVAYPEAMARMPLPWIWSYLFFTMVFILGMSTQITIAECMCTGIYDTFPRTREKKYFVVIGVAVVNFCAGLMLCFGSGIHLFNVFNDFSGTTALCISIFLEALVIIYFYGVTKIQSDIRDMIGGPSNLFGRIMGSSGYYIRFCWMITVPILAMVVCGLTAYGDEDKDEIDKAKKAVAYGQGEYDRIVGTIIGWLLAILPALAVPVLFATNVISWRNQGKPFIDLFRTQPSLPSYTRLSREDKDSSDDVKGTSHSSEENRLLHNENSHEE